MSNLSEEREYKTVSFNVMDKGLGIFLIGGEDKMDSFDVPGIFVKSIMPDGLASLDGRLKKGDQIASVNGKNFLNITKERAIKVLTDASEEGFVQLKILRDDKAKQDYKDLCDLYAFSNTSSTIDFEEFSSKNGTSRSFSRQKLDKKHTSQNENDNGETYSIDPNVRLKVKRLKQSLDFLGLEIDESNEEKLKASLDIDENGTVSYGEFVRKVKDMYSEEQKYERYPESTKSHKKIFSGANLQKTMGKNELMLKAVERELTRYKNENHDLKEELKLLRNKERLAEEFKKAAIESQNDYEVVIAKLEDDKRKLLESLGDHVTTEEATANHFEAKKAQVGRKIHQNATQKLLAFAKFVVDTLTQRIVKKQEPTAHQLLDYSSSDDVIVREAQKTLRAVTLLLHLDEDLPEKDTSKVSNQKQSSKLPHKVFSKSISNINDVTSNTNLIANNHATRISTTSNASGYTYPKSRYNLNQSMNNTTNREKENSFSSSILKRQKNQASLISLPARFT